MEGCKIKFKGKFIEEDEFKNELLNYYSNKAASHVDMPQELVIESLTQVDGHFFFDDSFNPETGKLNHSYYYKGGVSEGNPDGVKFDSGTTIGSEYTSKPITETKKGEKSREIGSEIHLMAEHLINGRNEGKTLEEALDGNDYFKYNPEYRKVAEKINELYNEWTSDGSTVLSEFKVGNVNKKIAGTIDIAVVHPDGSVTLYDFKGTRHEYGKYSSKTDSNNFQLQLYKQMLEKGDTKLGIPPLKIRDASVIPITYTVEETEDKEDFMLTETQVEDPVSITDKKIFPNKDKWYSAVKTKLQTGEEARHPDLKVFGVPDFDNFLENVSNYRGTTGGSVEKEAQRIVSRPHISDEGKYHYRLNGVNNPYNDEIASTDGGADGHQSRVNEVIKVLENNREASSNSIVTKVINAFENDYDPYISEEAKKEGKVRPDAKAKSNKLRSVLKRYNKKFDLMVAAKNVPGMENIGDDVIVVYKNFNKGEGEFSHIDLISVDEIVDNSIDPDSKGSSTIFGNHLTNNHAKAIANNLGIQSSTIMPNDRKSNVLMKLGLSAIALKKDNPDLKIGNISSYSIHEVDSKNTPTTRYTTMQSILEHINIIQNSGNKNLKKSFNKEVTEMLESDPSLKEFENYDNSEVDSFLNLMSLYLNAPKEIKEDLQYADLETNLPLILNKNSLLPSNANKSDLAKLGKKLREDDKEKKRLISLLKERMSKLKYKANNEDNVDYRDIKEFRMLSLTIAELNNMITKFAMPKDLNMWEKYVSSAGSTGIALIDDFTKAVKKAHDAASNELLEEYVGDKKKKFSELFGKNFQNKAIGNTSRYFERLIETVEAPVVGTSRTVKRKTMRFWDIESDNFKKLPQEHQQFVLDSQDFIEWYNDRVEEAFIKGSKEHPDEMERLKGWKRGHIPLMRSSTSNTIFKSVNRMLQQDDQGYVSGVKTMVKVEADKHQDRTEFFDAEDSLEQVVSVFENQIPKDPSGVDPVYGDAKRRERLGLNEYMKATAASGGEDSEAAHDLLETDLERILDFLMVGNVSKKHLEPLLPLQESVETIIHMHENDTLNELTNAKEYLKVYSQANLHNIRQTFSKNKKVEAALNSTTRLTSAFAVGWNIHSGMKNFIAGHLHQLENYTAASFSGNSKGKAGIKGYKETWKYLTKLKGGEANKLHMAMYDNRLCDVDIDKIKQGQNLKAGGQHFLSSRWAYWLNYASDYFHRSHMAITQMINDGVWEAYEEVEVEDGKVYRYNEEKDTRWKGEEGQLKLKAYKKLMGKEGFLDADGRLTKPYTFDEVNKIRKLADNTFESQNMANNPIYKQYVIGRLFLQMGGWLASKSERWYNREHMNKDLGRWEYIKMDDGEYKTVWKGHYMEGIVQTVKMLSGSVYYKFAGNDSRSFKEIWDSMQDHQKENVGRAIYDTAAASMLMAVINLIFDDDDEDETFTYSVLYGSAQEIFFGAHLTAAADTVRSPFPSLAVFFNITNNLLSFDSDRMFSGVTRTMGPLKGIEAFKDMGNDYEIFTK